MALAGVLALCACGGHAANGKGDAPDAAGTLRSRLRQTVEAVSYTHLTLPTT